MRVGQRPSFGLPKVPSLSLECGADVGCGLTHSGPVQNSPWGDPTAAPKDTEGLPQANPEWARIGFLWGYSLMNIPTVSLWWSIYTKSDEGLALANTQWLCVVCKRQNIFKYLEISIICQTPSSAVSPAFNSLPSPSLLNPYTASLIV